MTEWVVDLAGGGSARFEADRVNADGSGALKAFPAVFVGEVVTAGAPLIVFAAGEWLRVRREDVAVTISDGIEG